MKFLDAVDAASVREFKKISWDFYEQVFERFPHFASHLGLDKYDPLLGDNSPETHFAHIKLMECTLLAIENLPEAAFSGDDWLDRRAFLSELRTGLLSERDLCRWQNNPQQHCDAAVSSIFDLIVRHAGNLVRILPAIESRLSKIPKFLSQGADCIRLPVPLWIKLTGQACEGAVDFLREIEPELLLVAKNPTRTKRLLAGAAKAFSEYASAVARRKSGPSNGYSIGRENFEFLIREKLGFDCSLPEARANGERLVAQMEFLLAAEAAKLGKKSARTLLDEAAEAWLPARPLLDEYRDITRNLKGQLDHMGIVSLPERETLKVLPAPPFLRHQFPTAAYNAPPPFAKKQQGIFWVNDLSLGLNDEAKRRAEIRQHFGLELTSAHEGYPGHHLQFAIQNRHPSKLRRMVSHAIFYEGWTMWCEKMAVEKGLVQNPFARLLQTHDALWRAHRIVIDCGLHDGSLSFDGACKRLMKGVGFTRARAQGDVNWYTSSPSVPMSYLLGRIEVEKLHRRFVMGEGWTLRQFNDWMLGHGALPWSWILRARDRA